MVSLGGKGRVLVELIGLHGYSNIIMVGDGATDLEAKPPAEVFVGYGGNAVRERVKIGADWFITDFHDLIKVINTND